MLLNVSLANVNILSEIPRIFNFYVFSLSASDHSAPSQYWREARASSLDAFKEVTGIDLRKVGHTVRATCRVVFCFVVSLLSVCYSVRLACVQPTALWPHVPACLSTTSRAH